MKILSIVIVVFFCAAAWAQDEDERVYVESCSLFVRTTPYTPDHGDVSGKAMVEITVCDKAGIPIPRQKVAVTTTCGSLLSLSMHNISDNDSLPQGRSSFVTDKDGKIELFIADIPFNVRGRVTASCAYGPLQVRASNRFLITRKVIRRGTRKTSSRSVPSSK